MSKKTAVVIIAMCFLLAAAATLVDLSNQVKGILGIINGGTGLTTPIVYAPHQLGLSCNGTDEGAAFQAALTLLGGTPQGAIIQNQSGDHCNAGTTVLSFPPQVFWYGTGPEGSGQWGGYAPASSYLQVGCALDIYGCILFEGTGSSTGIGTAGISNMAIRNTTTCATFIHQTQMRGIFENDSFEGSAGSKTSPVACNDVFQLGLDIATCVTNHDCYFTGYGSIYHNIVTDKIRRVAVLNTVAAGTDWLIQGSSTDGNSSINASVIYGTCNDAGNKCGFTSLVCSTSNVVALAVTGGATATVACTGSNAIANGTQITVTAPGAGYTSAPTTATGTCGGTCSGTAALSTLIRGPFVDLEGYTGGSGNAIQNNFVITVGELGNSSSHVNPGDSHYAEMIYANYATNNYGLIVGDDSAHSPYASIADIVGSANEQSNEWHCQYYQSGSTNCYTSLNSSTYPSLVFDSPRSAMSSQFMSTSLMTAKTVALKSCYSVAGSALPSCDSSTLLQQKCVTDATLATPGMTYVGSGTYTVAVRCTYNSSGTTYTWIID